jgi:hypothetical protein
MLPGAHIVDARRDAMEAGWSCFKQQFYRLPHFACDLVDIGAYTRDYQRAMATWQAGQPQRVRIQHYEALLDDPELEIRALLAFCDLPWNDACLHSESNRAPVNTPNAWQVRAPIYRTAIGRWKHYEPQLCELQKLLAEQERS